MKYGVDIAVVRQLLKSVDINNTLNGGISQPDVNVVNKGDHLVMKVRVPGVEVLNLDVEIIHNNIVVQHPITLALSEENITLPQVVAAYPITAGIDYQNITASKVEDHLEVIIPYNDLARGLNRHIDINY